MVVPVALFLAILVERISSIARRRFSAIGRVVLLGVILAQSVLITSQGIIALQDGQHDYACSPQLIINRYLAEHYNGGKIFPSVYAAPIDASAARNGFKNLLYEGAGRFSAHALPNTARSGDWILIKPRNATQLLATP